MHASEWISISDNLGTFYGEEWVHYVWESVVEEPVSDFQHS